MLVGWEKGSLRGVYEDKEGAWGECGGEMEIGVNVWVRGREG